MNDRLKRDYIPEPRRFKTKIGVVDINYVVRRNPWVTAWWSMSLPGLGYIHMGLYLKGFILMSGEIFLNRMGHINEAILYTFTFQFDKVNQAINMNWALVYCSIWFFAIMDSYRVAVELNKYAILEEKQPVRQMKKSIMTIYGVNTLDKRTPWASVFLSLIFSGLSHICNNKLISGLTLLGWMTAITYYTKIPEMVIYTLTGQFSKIHSIVNYHWLLFFPSIYFFTIFDAYTHAVNYNKLFNIEQKYYLMDRFGNNDFELI